MAGASLLVLAASEPPVLPPAAVPGASLLLHFPLIVSVEALLMLPVAGTGVSRLRWLLDVLQFLILWLRLVAWSFAV